MTHGWLNLNKSIGISSAQAVNQVKKIFGIKKAGHLGTLDPLAFGVLPIALGEATKTIPYLSCDSKAYDFTIKWGEQRITDDLDGDIIKTSNIKPEYNQINCAIKNFVGEIKQTPPAFSAIKINGARAYKLARSGQKVNIKPRSVQIHKLKLISMDTVNNSADFSMQCGSGVYVRSIARDLGIVLNCFGHVTKLRRTMVGDFRENESVTIEQLTEKDEVIPIVSALKSMFKVEISLEEAGKIRKGQEVVLNNLRNLKNYGICYAIVGNVPIAICSFIYGCVKPIRVFNI
ncbi:MAG: tRNA pseudouridine(55) synthase TruB [Rickettsiales bacterium]|jgi:tRNA pseudouridine55 synthase|nr:tRNA pseudouridine(55) synthase TruB [Rickettsiales bacterium]